MPVPAVPDLAEVATAVFEEASLTELDPLTAVDLPRLPTPLFRQFPPKRLPRSR